MTNTAIILIAVLLIVFQLSIWYGYRQATYLQRIVKVRDKARQDNWDRCQTCGRHRDSIVDRCPYCGDVNE